MFHPLWFEQTQLLGKKETSMAADPKSLVVSEEITVFQVSGFEVNVRPERFQVGTAQENLFGPVRDLAIGTMQILDSVPMTALGINWAAHFSLADKDQWHSAGHRMIPIDFWKAVWGKHIGMRNVTVELERSDDRPGYVQVTVQPSNVVEHGVFVSINDHYNLLDKKGDRSSAASAGALIEKQWAVSEELGSKIMSDLYRECTR